MLDARPRYNISFLSKFEDSSPVKSILDKSDASILNRGPVDKINLAYPIKKSGHAYFGSFGFEVSADKIAGIIETLNLRDEIIRFMISRIDSGNLEISQRKIPHVGRDGIRSKLPAANFKDSAKPQVQILTNEAIQEKIEEILQ